MARPLVYLAGPYTTGSVEANVGRALAVGAALMDAGVDVFVPHLSHWWDAAHPRSYDAWLAYCLGLVARCDALARLPGVSPGAEREEALMRSLGRPVFRDVTAATAPDVVAALRVRAAPDDPMYALLAVTIARVTPRWGDARTVARVPVTLTSGQPATVIVWYGWPATAAAPKWDWWAETEDVKVAQSTGHARPDLLLADLRARGAPLFRAAWAPPRLPATYATPVTDVQLEAWEAHARATLAWTEDPEARAIETLCAEVRRQRIPAAGAP